MRDTVRATAEDRSAALAALLSTVEAGAEILSEIDAAFQKLHAATDAGRSRAAELSAGLALLSVEAERYRPPQHLHKKKRPWRPGRE